MFNLGKNACFGKPFKTRDERKAIYWFAFEDNYLLRHVLIVDELSSKEKGFNSYIICDNWGYSVDKWKSNDSIVSEWLEE